jgi:hypothetical protein
VISEITAIAHITTKQDMSRWTRAHADTPGITWSVFAGEGGTMIIVEHTEDRCSMNEHTEDRCSRNMADISAEPADPAPRPAERNGPVRVSA